MYKKIMLGLIYVLFFTSALADQSANPYQVQVPVASQSQTDWQIGINQALTQVLLEVSGNSKILQSPAIKKALSQTTTYIDSYAYVTQSKHLLLQVQFYPKAISQLLQSTGIKPSARQQVNTFVCLAIQTPHGKSIISNSDALAPAIQSSANRYGMKIILPLMDLQDMQTISADDIWQLRTAGCNSAAKRYGANTILIGKIFANTNKKWQGTWSLSSQKQNNNAQVLGNDLNTVITNIFNKAADIFATSTKSTAKNSTTQEITLSITHVNGLDDYADIMKYLRSLPQVNSVEASDINTADLTLNINFNGDINEFTDAINAGGQMTPDMSDSNTLTYQWLGNTTSPVSISNQQAINLNP